ncbi:MAG: hypothetical protein GY820_28565, partial [Gammaproteobacteria bacterium]|nr:hypothetical protein [Gammaproteobacteria bacterium]
MPGTEDTAQPINAQQQPALAQTAENVPPPNPELSESTDPQAVIRRQELQLELQQREMQEMRYEREQERSASDQQKTELTELKQQFARLLNPPPTLTQPLPNFNYAAPPQNEFQAQGPSNSQYNAPNTSSF